MGFVVGMFAVADVYVAAALALLGLALGLFIYLHRFLCMTDDASPVGS